MTMITLKPPNPRVSVFLDKQPKEKYFCIIKQTYEGNEHRVFDGDFDREKLIVHRISLWADDEITDIYDIEYESAEIIDETIRDYFECWIYHNGALKKLKT